MGSKLLVMDLDGTAVRDDYKPASGTKGALEKFRQAGNYSCFASGRRDADMATMGEDRWITDYLILNNGGKIERCGDRSTVYLELMDPEECRKVISYCLDNGLQLNVYNAGRWQCNKITEGTLEYCRFVGTVPEPFSSLDDVDWKGGIEHFYSSSDMWAVYDFVSSQLKGIQAVQSQEDCVDLLPAGVSKWKTILRLAGMLGVSEEDIITAGNYYNDIDMLMNAATGIAVANAIDEVKEAAGFVTENDNNGEVVAEMVDGILEGRYTK